MDDGRDGPPLIVMASGWFFGAGVLLLLPRQWVSAGAAIAIGVVLSLVARRRAPKPAAARKAAAAREGAAARERAVAGPPDHS